MIAGERKSAHKLALGLEIAAAYLQVRRMVKGVALPTLLRTLRDVEPRREAAGMDESLRLGRAVRRTLAILPGDGRCLTQSLVLTKLLSRRGVTSELVIGVAQDDGFAAHAWVEHENVPLLPAFERKFDKLARL